jgi:protein gp37
MRSHQKNPKMQALYGGLTTPDGKWNGRITLMAQNLDLPKRRRKRPLVWSIWNELFHEKVPWEYIDEAFAVMESCYKPGKPHDIFIALTKRPENMLAYALNRQERGLTWPLNVVAGTTAGNQEMADERLPYLVYLKAVFPRVITIVSAEPLLGQMDIKPYLSVKCPVCEGTCSVPCYEDGVFGGGRACPGCIDSPRGQGWLPGIDSVIAGAETGTDARVTHPSWAWSLKEQTVGYGATFYWKSWGEYLCESITLADREHISAIDVNGDYWALSIKNGRVSHMGPDAMKWTCDCVGLPAKGMVQWHRVGKKNAGRLLDGRTWDDLPWPVDGGGAVSG